MYTHAIPQLARHAIHLLPVPLLALGFVPAWSQGPLYPHVEFWGRCDGSAVHLTLQGEDDGQHDEVVGIDIYRRTHGACGDEEIRITMDPIPRLRSQPFVLEFTDSHVSDGVLYHYQAVGVDAERRTRTSLYTVYWMPGSNDATFAGCGRTLAGHGTLVDDGWAWILQPCPGSCFGPAFVEPWFHDLEPYLGTGTPLRLYGGFGWTVEGHMMVVDGFEVEQCTTAVQPSTWGDVKRLFKNGAR
jgi:hypothetical protein